ncbi:MAG TPA: hypothetical protein VJ327_11135 [Patescibacteria group bacterium]|nr:hypothetical protein [Patescibacteria group bacterium]
MKRKALFERLEDKFKQEEKNINECARIIYSGIGYHVEEGYDFSTANHPQEKACYALAIKTFNFWQGKLMVNGKKKDNGR